jgi:hypothetical protein
MTSCHRVRTWDSVKFSKGHEQSDVALTASASVVEGSPQMINLDLPADVLWVPADQVPETGAETPPNRRHFGSLRQAICFAMDELTIFGSRPRKAISPSNRSNSFTDR